MEDDLVEKLFGLFDSKYKVRYPRVSESTTNLNTKETIKKIHENNSSQAKIPKVIDNVNINTLNNKGSGVTTKKEMIKELEVLILENEIEGLRKIGFIIHRELKLKAYTVSQTLVEITDKHKHEYKKFFAFVYSLDINHAIEREYLYLNIVDTTNKMLLDYARKMLHQFAKDNKKHEKSILKRASQQIKDIVKRKKRENLNLICTELSICRSYPAYSHCVVEFLHTILNLSANKLDVAIVVFQNIFEANKDIFKPIMNRKVKDALRVGFQSSDNENSNRDSLTDIKLGIELSYNIFDNYTKLVVFKKKCIRILLDIIDKTIEPYYEVVSAAFDTVQKVIPDWVNGDRNDFDVFFTKFLEDVVIIPIKYYLTPISKQEIPVLLSVLFNARVNPVDYSKYNYLFANGSKLVEGEGDYQESEELKFSFK